MFRKKDLERKMQEQQEKMHLIQWEKQEIEARLDALRKTVCVESERYFDYINAL